MLTPNEKKLLNCSNKTIIKDALINLESKRIITLRLIALHDKIIVECNKILDNNPISAYALNERSAAQEKLDMLNTRVKNIDSLVDKLLLKKIHDTLDTLNTR